MEKFFKLKKNNTTVGTEVIAGLTTFFAMSYILFVNPSVLHQTGMDLQAVFLATIIASAVGTLVMGLFANVPYVLAPGMGLSAFFTYIVVLSLGYTWQEALAMVFICGLIDVVITLTNVRRMLITAIPRALQHALAGGIGIFIAYIGVKNAGLINYLFAPGTYSVVGTGADQGEATIIGSSSAVPELVNFNNPAVLVAIFGIFLTAILVVKKVRGGILISIIVTTIVAILVGVVNLSSVDLHVNSLVNSFEKLSLIFGAALGQDGIVALFSHTSKIPLTLMTILAFAMTNTFDALGTFIGTGKRAGLFVKEEMHIMKHRRGFSTKLDKALIADFTATTIGSIVGTSNVTTYVESTAGIGTGGRTGLTSVVAAVMFLVSSVLAPMVSLVPTQATASALIIVGIMMMSAFKEINWHEMSEAIPAFFASVFMGFTYSISYGIATGFIFYIVTKVIDKKVKEIHPILWIVSILFIINWVVLALISG